MSDVIGKLQLHADHLPAIHYSVPMLREAIAELESLQKQVNEIKGLAELWSNFDGLVLVNHERDRGEELCYSRLKSCIDAIVESR